MLADCKYKKTETFGMRVYHQYVGDCMRRGLKWIRYTRRGDYLTIIDLRLPAVTESVINQECAERFERWYHWMKRSTVARQQTETKT